MNLRRFHDGGGMTGTDFATADSTRQRLILRKPNGNSKLRQTILVDMNNKRQFSAFRSILSFLPAMITVFVRCFKKKFIAAPYSLSRGGAPKGAVFQFPHLLDGDLRQTQQKPQSRRVERPRRHLGRKSFPAEKCGRSAGNLPAHRRRCQVAVYPGISARKSGRRLRVPKYSGRCPRIQAEQMDGADAVGIFVREKPEMISAVPSGQKSVRTSKELSYNIGY